MVFSVELLSPNFQNRSRSGIDSLIIVPVKGSAKEYINKILRPHHDQSAHYVVDEKGTVYSTLKEDVAAKMPAFSYWKGRTDIPDSAIIIVIANEKDNLPPQQADSFAALANEVVHRHHILPCNVVSCHDISFLSYPYSPPFIPWRLLAQNGVGLWTDDDGSYDEEGNILNVLDSIGYQINIPSHKAAIRSFQSHFLLRPDGTVNTEEKATIRRAKAIIGLIGDCS